MTTPCSPDCLEWRAYCDHEVLGFFCPCRMDEHLPKCPNAKPAPPQDAPDLEAAAWEATHPVEGSERLARAYLALRDRLASGNRAFVEMNAVFEAVMRAIRGEPLSDFDLSHGAVYEAQMLREANNAHIRITADLRDRLAAMQADHQGEVR